MNRRDAKVIYLDFFINTLLNIWTSLNDFLVDECLFVGPKASWSSLLYVWVSMIQVRYNKRMGTEGLSFYHTNMLCSLNQMLAVIVEPAPCFVIPNCQTHYSSRCPMCGTCQNNVICRLFTSRTLAFR